MKKIRGSIRKVWNKHYATIVLVAWFAIWTIIGSVAAVREIKRMALDENDMQYLKSVAEYVYDQGEQCIYEVSNDVKLTMNETAIQVRYKYPEFESVECRVEKGQLVFHHKINYLLVYAYCFVCVFSWIFVGYTVLYTVLYLGVKVESWYENKKGYACNEDGDNK